MTIPGGLGNVVALLVAVGALVLLLIGDLAPPVAIGAILLSIAIILK
jgi:hypothetical protein